MPYNNVTGRSDAGALIPEEVTREIFQALPTQSVILRLARRLQNMSRAQLRMPVLSAMPEVYFVNGDTGLKQTSKQQWENKYINAEEMAVIVPIPNAVFDDADYDLWAEIQPRVVEAIGAKIDSTVLFGGADAPSSWPDAILTQCVAASHTVDLSTTEGAGDDLYDAVMGPSGTMAKVEGDGYGINGHIGSLSMMGKLRGLRTSDGIPIFHRADSGPRDVQSAPQWAISGFPIEFPANGGFDALQALMFSGDWRQLVYAWRQELTFEKFDQGVIQDGAGQILYNLMQQDMKALRVVMRWGWQVPNPVNLVNPTEATRLPFAALVP